MAQPSTPGQASQSIFGGPIPVAGTAQSQGIVSQVSSALTSQQPAPTPSLAASASSSSNNTYIMPNSPAKGRTVADGYRPKVTRTLGQRPACLVNASVTYCGNNQIYAFGGFDQYTDEVYNHVLRLDLVSHQWSLVDNYGDIPGVRMGHTATLYQGDKLLVFGGENEHRTYLSDLIVFDLKTAHWTQPQVTGPIPKGRARHAAVLHEDKLFVIGGITGQNNYVLDDICYLDLKTFTWSKSWRFVARYDHSAYIWGDRVWVFGGLSEDMDKIGDLWWLDLKGNPQFDSRPQIGAFDRTPINSRVSGSPRAPYAMAQAPVVGASGYAANSRTAQVNPPSFQLKSFAPMAPGSISSLKFMSGPAIPAQGSGIHYHAYSSGTLLYFVTPAPTITPREYLGPNGYEEYLSDIMEIDLRRYGFLGDNLASDSHTESRPSATRIVDQPSKGLGADLAKLFNQPPETGSGTDFIVTALARDYDEDDTLSSGLIRSDDTPRDQNWLSADTPTSQPIHVHKLILQARWPHFARLYNAQMAEFHTKKMHIPEPYTVVKAFLYYLYTDSIHGTSDAESDATTGLSEVAGLLVMSNIYNIPHLRLLCVNRLAKELDVDHACVIWYCAGLANEEWLRRRSANFCMTHWGRIVRTQGFLRLPRSALVELSQEIDMEGRVVGGDELEWGGMAGRFGEGMGHGARKESISSSHTQMLESEADDDDGMEIN
ncbi:hypothetical protein G7Z17_g12133 [Cylindrodendrum hubeiense]|uniref:BTB domain-containing protein n=1 Tax=Cylindrodendrum hubeiense TaxID=595255 RepID=A0A9P5GY96_9HYPO|nr:hypothetical protein G7Z17_g12133 [Cylindrodendrum hubeiense]